MGKRKPRSERRGEQSTVKFVAPLVIVVAGLYAYQGSLEHPFVFDDFASIRTNPTIRELWPPWEVLSTPPHRAVTGRPVVNLSLALNYAWGEYDVSSYHAFNLTVHLLLALALFGVVRRTLESDGLRERYGDAARGLALATALIWVVHPLATEAVTYVIQRTESLMALFLVLTLYCLIRGSVASDSKGWYATAIAAFALGAGSKEVMAAALPVALIYDRFFLATSLREVFKRRWWVYVAMVSILFLGALASGRFRADVPELFSKEISPWNYALTQLGVVTHYLRLSIWPHPLVADYHDWPVATSIGAVLPSLVLVLALLGVTLWGICRLHKLAFLGVWVLLILAPTSSIWPIPAEIAAERRMYLPLAAIVLLGVLGTHWSFNRFVRHRSQAGLRRILQVASVIVITVLFAQLTIRRNQVYRDHAAFWGDVVAKRPENTRARGNLGDYLFKQGDREGSLPHFEEAVRLRPDAAIARYNLAVNLASLDRTDEAIEHYREVVRIDPDHVKAHSGIAVLQYRRGRLDEAIQHFSEVVRIEPGRKNAHYHLALALERANRLDEAMLQMEKALEVDPQSQEARAGLERLRGREVPR